MLNETNLSRVDLNLLMLFDVVLMQRHVGRAAAKLNLTPSAVSHGLGRLRRLLNDPLFLKTPKGVVPTARAMQLAEPVAEILARVRSIVDTAAPFDAATSTRQFAIGAPDGLVAVFLTALLADLRRRAPGIDIGVRQLLPPQSGARIGQAWEPVLAELEARTIDIAIVPLDAVPARFVAAPLFEEDFVIAMRAKHRLANGLTLKQFCEADHLVVSLTGDRHGFVDSVLAERGLSRRVALTAPNFMMALAVAAETDLITALPRRFASMYAARFDVVLREAPLRLPRFPTSIIALKVAMMDAGLDWLFDAIRAAVGPAAKPQARRRGQTG
jgi:DNA-binding transcriptional LysR family regulator